MDTKKAFGACSVRELHWGDGARRGASGGFGSAIADLAIEGRTRFDLESFRTDRFGRIDAF